MTPTKRQVQNWYNAAMIVQRKTRQSKLSETTVELVGGPVEMIGSVLYGAVRCENGCFTGFACISVGPRGGVSIKNETYTSY